MLHQDLGINVLTQVFQLVGSFGSKCLGIGQGTRHEKLQEAFKQVGVRVGELGNAGPIQGPRQGLNFEIEGWHQGEAASSYKHGNILLLGGAKATTGSVLHDAVATAAAVVFVCHHGLLFFL